MELRRRGNRGGERHVVVPLTGEMINDHHLQTSMEAREGEGEEEEEEELMREYYCGGSNNSNATIFTKVPTSITRWSLLVKLRLRKSDMVEDSLILNSLSSLSHASFHQTFLLHIPPPAFTDDYHFEVRRDVGWFHYHVPSLMFTSFYHYDFLVEFAHS